MTPLVVLKPDRRGAVDVLKGHWQWHRLDSHRVARFGCPRCGRASVLDTYAIAASGLVVPEVRCGGSPACRWSSYVRLLGAEVPKFQWTMRDLELRRQRVPEELHPELRGRMEAVLVDLGARVVPYEGFRSDTMQEQRRREGASDAGAGESPHNYRPPRSDGALAVDLVLNPQLVPVRPHPKDPAYPDLWDEETAEALATWEALEQAAVRHHLERVLIRDRATGVKRRDRPHLQLPGWRSLVRQ